MPKLEYLRQDRDDYLVIFNGKIAGYVHITANFRSDRWLWAIDSSVPGAGGRKGWALNFEDAKTKFEAAWASAEGPETKKPAAP